ncbi:MAG: hypothetical protein CL424_08470 [Acidimicrobiaceae bacterium]|nr:hypothetical protein [Acidimicrobiaceae bacterium]
MTSATEPHTSPLPPPTPEPSAAPDPIADSGHSTVDHVAPPPPAAPPTFTPPPTPAPTSPPTTAPSRGRSHSAGHIVALVIGCLALLPSLGMLAGGVFVTVAHGVADDGYFDVTLDRVTSDGVAVAAVDLWESAADDEDWPWVLDWLDPDIRLDVRGGASTDEIFVGIAPTGDVEAYLADASFDEITDFSDREAIYTPRAGSDAVAPPTEQTFWVAQAAGSGEQRLDWEARNGNWSVVVMNADGSADVAADVTVGVSSDAVLPIGIVLIVLGAIGVLGSVALIVIGARGRAAT